MRHCLRWEVWTEHREQPGLPGICQRLHGEGSPLHSVSAGENLGEQREHAQHLLFQSARSAIFPLLALPRFEQHKGHVGRSGSRARRRLNVGEVAMALKYCPNGECVNFQCEIDTEATQCVMCAWHLVPGKKSSEKASENLQCGDTEAA
jgi:hypothetical protein